MKYFWLSPKNQRHNNWLFYTESMETGIRLREQYVPLQCAECKKYDELAAIELGISPDVKIRSKSDYLMSDDGLICVSEAAQKVLLEVCPTSVRFVSLPGDSRYSILLPTSFVPTDPAKSHMEFHRPCQRCGRFRETCLSPALASMSLPSGSNVFACPDLAIEGYRERRFWFLASEDVVSAFRAARLSGVEFEPA
jgi:hypothetical protein